MENVVVVAMFLVHPGREDEAVEALTPTIEGTHAEEGCISYALHRDASTPNRLILIENWASREALDSHLQQPYVAQLGAVAEEFLVEPPTIHFSEPVPVGDSKKGSL